jgi:uncharacterized damage-inducible protein DinB
MNFELDGAQEILRSTPVTLRALLAGLSDPWITARRSTDEWSALDVVGHLIHGERTDWLPRLRHVLEHGESRPFEPFDRFAQFQHSQGKTIADLLNEFDTLRRQNVDALVQLDLTPAQLDLRGTHPELGTVTVRQLLATWVVHDLAHLAQIARGLALEYSAEVGPWKAYLGVLSD